MSATVDMLLMENRTERGSAESSVELLLARVPRAEVDDLVQDIFLHAFKKLHTLRDTSAFGPWIAMIARNRAVDFHRRSKESVEITDEVRGSDTHDSRAKEILELIRSLPEA